MSTPGKIIVTGGAGLVGQNLIQRLASRGRYEIVAIDKHPANTTLLRRLNPTVEVVEADLAQSGAWEKKFEGAGTLVLNHAQIGALTEYPFIANNVTATERVIAAARRAGVANVVHISSSVVHSAACDFYTESKKAQEKLVVDSGLPVTILRPTLMFGWFDRKHLGWLARFMARAPLFPVPGHGRYLRQPLYAGDFCDIVISCLKRRITGIYNISGLERIDYIDLIRMLRSTLQLKTPVVKLPYRLFWAMLHVYTILDRDTPFTTKQLEALVTPDIFEVIDWPAIFDVRATPLAEALRETFQHPDYSNVLLEF
jgi:nucleoside-diphosphate-sugar epimerase